MPYITSCQNVSSCTATIRVRSC